MPPYKGKKNYTSKKRRYSKKKSTIDKLKNDIAYLKKQNKQNRPELQHDDTTDIAANLYSTPTIVKVTAGASNERVTIKSVQLKGHIIAPATTAINVYARIILFTDKSNEGAAIPAWTDVYKSSAGSAAVMSLRALTQDKNEGTRFKIIYDKIVKIVKDTDGTVDDSKYFDVFKKLDIPSINETGYWEAGGLYLAYVADCATDILDFTYQIRTRSVPHNNS